MTTLDPDRLRAEFEEWARLSQLRLSRTPDGDYADVRTDVPWAAYQAAAERYYAQGRREGLERARGICVEKDDPYALWCADAIEREIDDAK